MFRREALLGVGAVCGSIVSAGCVGEFEDSGEGGNEARDEIEAAVEYLDEANSILVEATEDAPASSSSFNPNEVTRRTDKARDHLETARPNATDDQLDAIENLTHFADAFDEFATVYAGIDGLESDWEKIESLVQAERIDEARTELRESSDRLEEVQTSLDVGGEAAQQVDLEFSSGSELDQQDFEEWSAEADQMVTDMLQMHDAFEFFLDGYEHTIAGQEYLEDERYGAAAGRFEQATEAFDEMVSTLRDAEKDVHEEMQSGFIELGCYAEALRDGTDHMATGSEYAADGRYTEAEQEFDKAEPAFNRNC